MECLTLGKGEKTSGQSAMWSLDKVRAGLGTVSWDWGDKLTKAHGGNHCKNTKLSDSITPYHLVEGNVYNKDILQNRVYFLKKSFHSILQSVAQSKYNFIADSLEELRLLLQGWWEAAVFGSFHPLHMEKILLLDSLKVEIYFPEPRLPAVRNRDFSTGGIWGLGHVALAQAHEGLDSCSWIEFVFSCIKAQKLFLACAWWLTCVTEGWETLRPWVWALVELPLSKIGNALALFGIHCPHVPSFIRSEKLKKKHSSGFGTPVSDPSLDNFLLRFHNPSKSLQTYFLNNCIVSWGSICIITNLFFIQDVRIAFQRCFS